MALTTPKLPGTLPILQPTVLHAHPLPVLMRGAWLQTLRRKEVFVLFLLLGLYAAAALILRIVGVQTPDAARFVLGLGLQLGSVLSAMLVVVSATRALPPEFEQRTIYPVLAKPVSRGELLLGKALPVWAAGTIALGSFVLASTLLAPGLPYQKLIVLAEALAAKCLGLAVLTALGVAGSLYLPLAINMLLTGAYALGCGMALNIIAQAGAAGGWIARLLPDLGVFDHFQRYAEGGAALGVGALGALFGYGALWCVLLGGLAMRRFKRMAL